MADKKGRVSEIIKRNLSEIIIYKLKNDVCKFASIHKVELSKDYSNCKIYVSHIQKDNVAKLVNYLQANASLIRSMLAKTLDIYKTPYLTFYSDDLFEEDNHLNELFEKIKKEKKKVLKDIK